MTRLAALPVLLVLVAPAAFAAETTVRSYAIPGQGSLELDVPMRWREDLGWTDGDHRPTVTFRPAAGSDFVMRIEVLPPPADAPEDFATLAWLRAVVEDGARRSLGIADAASLLLEEIGEGQAVGWYYSVTDEALPDPPPAGTFRVMTQGASAAGRIVLTSTILTQRSWGTELSDALALLRTARVSDRPADAWRVPGESALARGGLGQRYDLATPEGFELLSSSPLQLRDAETGGLFSVDVVRGRSTVKAELQRLEAEVESRSPGQWILRRRGPGLLSGETAARFVALDELRDELVASWAVPLDDAVLTATWRVHPTREKAGEARLKRLLEALRIKPAQAAPATTR